MYKNHTVSEIIQNYKRQRNRTLFFGTESILLTPRIWKLIPADIKNTYSLGIFKEKLKFWTTDKCPWRLCRTYIGNVGFN